ncbi:hypothetical protein MMC34_002540 [Xylographa carneopallida]|nr:hypothetical protein [Xylographa carneopallida]
MAWPNPFRAHDENTQTCWGYTFQLTPQHLTPEKTHPMKFSYDVLGEQALDRLNEISPPPRSALPRNSNKYAEARPASGGAKQADNPDPTPRRDLYTLLRDHAPHDETLGKLWREVNTVPTWVDWEQIARGQDVFYRYGGPALTGLCFQSLLGGMGANRVVETLARTGGFSTKVARHRLFETTQHILQCTRSLQSIQPGGDGFASSIRVRLLHAAVRQRIVKLAKQRPEYYDTEKWGIPINDLDCIATIGTFSATLVWLAFPRQGIWLRQQEIVDYIALFRYIGYLTGTPTDYFETPEKARTVMESLLMYEIDPSETSKTLAANVIRSLEAQPPQYASRAMLEANSRWLNGNELCDALGLGRPGFYYWALVAGQCLFFMAICYTYRSIPYLDRRKIAALRKIFWAVIVDGKYGLQHETTFDFKYIPDMHKTTHREEPDRSGLTQPGIERRNLQALLLGCGFLSVSAVVGYRIVSGLAKHFVYSLV